MAPNANQKVLNRLGNQLEVTANYLSQHALTNEKMILIQNAMHSLNWQTRWASAGPLARLLITNQIALFGLEQAESEAGFVGPSIKKLNIAAYQLMQSFVDRDEVGLTDLLAIATQLITLGVVYISTQTLSFRKDMFPRHDPPAAKKAGVLLRDLGLRILCGSKMIQTSLKGFAKELGIEERNQKIIGEIGALQVLLLLFVLHDDEPDLLETLTQFMAPILDSLEQALEKAPMEEEIRIMAASQLQFIRLSLEHNDIEAVKQAIETSLDVFDLSYKTLKEEGKTLSKFCAQLNMSFNNIFNQIGAATTTMNQSA